MSTRTILVASAAFLIALAAVEVPAQVSPKPAAPTVKSSSNANQTQAAGKEGVMNRCRNASGKIVYLDRPCATQGLEQLGTVKGTASSRGAPVAPEQSQDRIIWVDPTTGKTQIIEYK